MTPLTTQREVILADGKAHRLVYTHRTLATAEYLLKRQGHKMALLGPASRTFWTEMTDREEDGSGADGDAITFDQFKVGVLLFCGLIHENPKLTLEEAQDQITFQNAAAVNNAVMEAVYEALAPLVEKPPAQTPREQAGEVPLAQETGGASDGPSPEKTLDSEPGPIQ